MSTRRGKRRKKERRMDDGRKRERERAGKEENKHKYLSYLFGEASIGKSGKSMWYIKLEDENMVLSLSRQVFLFLFPLKV